MNRETIFTVRHEDLTRLNFQKLLWTEARRLSMCSLVLRIINAELTVLTFMLTPPPPLNIQKVYYFTRWYRLQGGSIFAAPARALFCTECFVAGYFFCRKPCTTKRRFITRCQ